MSDEDRIARLEARIAALKAERQPAKPHQEEHYSQAQQGWRMVIELVTGLLIGFGMGYGLDWFFGTLPIFLVLFTLLGLGAGINVMLRTAQEFQRQNIEAATAADTEETAARAADEDGKA